jgi:hypothetical protein
MVRWRRAPRRVLSIVCNGPPEFHGLDWHMDLGVTLFRCGHLGKLPRVSMVAKMDEGLG